MSLSEETNRAPAPRSPLFLKDYNLHWFTGFLLAMGFYLLIPVLPLYVVRVLGEPEGKVGAIIGIYTLSAVLIRPFAGFFLDRYGRKVVYLIALGVFSFFLILYPLAASFFLLLVIRFFHGFSWGALTTGGGTIVADLVPASRRAEGIGYYGLTMTLAMSVGPALGVFVLNENNFNFVFFYAFLLTAFAWGIAWFVRHPYVPGANSTFRLSSLYEPSVFSIGLAVAFVTGVYGGVISYIVIFSEKVGVQNSGAFFLFYAATMSLIRPLAGPVQDRRGPLPVLIPGFIANISGFYLLSQTSEPFGLYLSAVILGLGNGMIWPTFMSMVVDMVPPERRGAATATYFSAVDIGIGAGSILLGIVAEQTSIRDMFFYSSEILLIPAALVFFLIYPSYKKRMKQSRKEDQDNSIASP